jgi:hypothetical protein
MKGSPKGIETAFDPLIKMRTHSMRDTIVAWSRRAGKSFWEFPAVESMLSKESRWALEDLTTDPVQFRKTVCDSHPWVMLDKLMTKRDSIFSITFEVERIMDNKYHLCARDAETIAFFRSNRLMFRDTTPIQMKWIVPHKLVGLVLDGTDDSGTTIVPSWAPIFRLNYDSLEFLEEASLVPLCPIEDLEWSRM